MKFRHILPSLLATLIVPAANAADVGPYVGAGVGYADVLTDDTEDDLQDFLGSQGITADLDNDTDNFNWRVFGGYQFHPNYGFEVAYVGLGDVDLTATEIGAPGRTVDVSTDIWGIEFAATGAYPVTENWDLTAKVGGMYYDAEADVDVTGPVVGSFEAEDTGVAFTGGVGFTRKIGPNWLMRGGWQYVDVDEINHLFSTSIGYRFDW